ncbi:MAG TPA: hypothetical protein V6C89_17820 [Drouetiella sp.]|jgi:hypothetical protein
MHFKNSMTMLLAAAALTPSMVPAAFADACSSKLVKTSYQRISPRTVKETKIYESTRLISKATPARKFVHRSTFVRKTAYMAPQTRTFTTTTRTTSMFIPVRDYTAPVAIVRPVVVAPTSTTVLRASGLVPATTVIRASAIAPTTTVLRASELAPARTTIIRETVAPSTTVIRAASMDPACAVLRTQSVLTPAPMISNSGFVAAPGETVVFKEKHGKLKEVGTLAPAVWY